MLRILLSVRLGEKRWTQKQLADATGIRRNTINDLYHEMTDRVSLEQLDLICKALDCKISDLLVQEEDLDDLTRSRLATPRCRYITSDTTNQMTIANTTASTLRPKLFVIRFVSLRNMFQPPFQFCQIRFGVLRKFCCKSQLTFQEIRINITIQSTFHGQGNSSCLF